MVVGSEVGRLEASTPVVPLNGDSENRPDNVRVRGGTLDTPVGCALVGIVVDSFEGGGSSGEDGGSSWPPMARHDSARTGSSNASDWPN